MSGGFLLDTNIPSETLRQVPDPKVAAWLKGQSREVQFVSVVTIPALVRAARSSRHASDRRALGSD